MLFSIVACNKSERLSDNKSNKYITDYAGINLDSFETQYSTDPTTGDLIITFAESEDIVLHSEQASDLGFQNLEISKGIYNIVVTSNNSNFGELELDIENYQLVSGSDFPTIELGVKFIIAKVWKQCNGTGPLQYCTCGVGFRCGFLQSRSHLISADNDGKATTGNVEFDSLSNKMKIVFTSPLP